ncbi:hypothetical protein [Bifidobacterium margollesii]|nr:hypothetical protein [Bifidobacterium margollesii]
MSFGDQHRTIAGKGVTMQPSAQVSVLDDARIAEVRRLRRAAIRRRQILVISLLAVAVLVLVLALALHFSPAFALIPVVLDAVVLALGARASRQAREWETKVAKAKRASRHRRQREREAAAKSAAGVSDAEAATDAMSRAEIERTIERAKAEKLAAIAEREMRMHGERPGSAAVAAEADRPASVAPRKVRRRTDTTSGAGVERNMDAQSQPSAQPVPAQTQPASSRPQAAPVERPVQSPSEPVASAVSDGSAQSDETRPDQQVREAEDTTAELKKVTRSHALDAFELAASQDLISFSLGAPRHGQEVRSAEPQSLEIKSTKQVAHAEPKPVAKPSEQDGKGGTELSPDEKPVVPAPDPAMGRLIDAKKAERSAEAKTEARTRDAVREAVRDAVAAPAKTSDSLGGDVDAVLARRRG